MKDSFFFIVENVCHPYNPFHRAFPHFYSHLTVSYALYTSFLLTDLSVNKKLSGELQFCSYIINSPDIKFPCLPIPAKLDKFHCITIFLKYNNNDYNIRMSFLQS